MAVVFSGCSAIDEDLSDCDETLKLDYELHLVTNLSIELQKELDKKTDARLLAGRHIVEGQTDNALDTWVQEGWLQTHLNMVLHILHIGLKA